MTTFDDRERAFETKFALEEETAFRVRGRRDRLAAEWAGDKLGLSGEALDAYAAALIAADLTEAGDGPVLRKLAADLDGQVSEAEVRERLDALMNQARSEIEAGR